MNKEVKKKNYDNVSNKRNSYFFKSSVIILLLIIIILLLLRGCGYVKTNQYIPTGDFDIYEITTKECPACEKCKECDNNSCNEDDGTQPVINIIDDIKEEGLIVYDNDIVWDDDNIANIFSHASYEIVSKKIAPGSTNIYKFVVKNMNQFAVNYTIKFKETNAKNISMKYRLKRESTYIIGSTSQWVDANSLSVNITSLSSKDLDTYYLEWKWFHDDNYDTAIGIDDTSIYSLKIKVDAEEV